VRMETGGGTRRAASQWIACPPQGIAKNWGWAGSPEAAHLVDELCNAPANPNTSGTMFTTGVIGLHCSSVLPCGVQM
jgi:hypothetical protein